MPDCSTTVTPELLRGMVRGASRELLDREDLARLRERIAAAVTAP